MVKKAPIWTGRTDLHLKVLMSRIRDLRVDIKRRARRGAYNTTEQAKLLRLIKKAKAAIADANFV